MLEDETTHTTAETRRTQGKNEVIHPKGKSTSTWRARLGVEGREPLRLELWALVLRAATVCAAAATALGFCGAVAVRAAADRGGAAAAHGCRGDGAWAHGWRKVEQDGVE